MLDGGWDLGLREPMITSEGAAVRDGSFLGEGAGVWGGCLSNIGRWSVGPVCSRRPPP